jgi:tyrosinase
MLIRKNVWELGSDWAEPILWYARGVAALQARPLAEPTSWRFYAAIHGIHPELWQELGYLDFAEPTPPRESIRRFWRQCQHGSWHFLPWHRGYTLAFERTLRAAVVALGGPADWALPYWDYFKPGQNRLPPAFASRDWPDGQGNNPLFIPRRYGPGGDGDVFVPLDAVNLEALNEPDFSGVDSGGSPGFGGVDTGFSHGGRVHGALETQPHDWVHGLVGGGRSTFDVGLMSNPDTAALDPIFWLHHSNIDRLWQVWRERAAEHTDPTAPSWLEGPASIGERDFAMPLPDAVTWSFTPAQMTDLVSLDYAYDAVAPEPASTLFTDRLPGERVERLAAGKRVATARVGRETVEVVGASRSAAPVRGAEARVAVELVPAARQKVTTSLFSDRGPPDRVFLNLENVRGLYDAAAFRVYVGLAPSDAPEQHPERLAGNVALFGVRKASLPTEEHGGEGLTFVLEITKLVDAVLEDALDADTLEVRLVPLRPIEPEAQINIGRISITRQGHL